MLSSRASSATMFWQRDEISRRVRSSVGSVASERAREASEDFSAICRYSCSAVRRSLGSNDLSVVVREVGDRRYSVRRALVARLLVSSACANEAAAAPEVCDPASKLDMENSLTACWAFPTKVRSVGCTRSLRKIVTTFTFSRP